MLSGDLEAAQQCGEERQTADMMNPRRLPSHQVTQQGHRLQSASRSVKRLIQLL